MQVGNGLVRSDQQEPVRFTAGGRYLGHELAGGDANGRGDTEFVPHTPANNRPDLPRTPQPPDGSADVQEGFVDAQRFHQVRDRAEDGHQLRGHLVVELVPWLDDDCRGADARSHRHGHSRLDAKFPCLVGSGQHHRPVRRIAHNDRFSDQFRTAPEFHGDEKCVHVHVHDAAST
ncbi:hypothetical protein D9M72_417910 [compost metagenome]